MFWTFVVSLRCLVGLVNLNIGMLKNLLGELDRYHE